MRVFVRSYRIAVLTALVSGAAFTGLVITSLAGLTIARRLSLVDYGTLTYFVGWLTPLLLVLGLGMSTRVIKLVSAAQETDSLTRLGSELYTLLIMRLITLSPLPLFGAILAMWSGQKPYLLVTLAAVVAVISDFLLGILRGHRQSIAVMIVLLLQPGVYLGLLINGFAYSVEGVFYALILSFLANVIFELIWLRQGKLIPPLQRPFFITSFARELVGSSSRIYLVGLYQTIFNTWLILILGMLGAYQIVAELSIPLTLVSLLTSVNAPILVTMVLPRLARMDASARNSFHIAYRLIWAVALAGAATLAAFAEPVIHLLYSARYVHTAPLLILQAPLVVILAMESLMTMTQIGLDQYRTAIRLQITRLILLIAGTAVVLLTPLDQSSEQFGLSLAYIGAAATGLAFQFGIVPKSLGIMTPWSGIAIAGLLAITTTLILRGIVGTQAPLWLAMTGAVMAGAVALILTTSLIFRHELSRLVYRRAEMAYQARPLMNEKHEL